MLWLFSQMFLLCAVSFAAGSLVTWSAVRGRPQPERPKARLALPAPRPAAEQVVIAKQPVVEQEPLPVKGNPKTRVYHTPESPYYRRMKGDTTFGSEAEALTAGYRMWTTKGRVKA
ncbi:sunset domain-containing protein [Lentzea sp. E54]|uniref:sunset domain-containing protein n=1 Tax=Lentzea xerophila TaxID=3435883 RepID=UPI003DA6703B